MDLASIIAFLETERLSFTFTPLGLYYLSRRRADGGQTVDLGKILRGEAAPDSETRLIIEETSNFLETGRHGMALDLSGLTHFQRAVLGEVMKIPPGKTSTYKRLAAALGKPGAAQAVGSAVTQNPVLYFIPAHRVLPESGLLLCKTGAGSLREKLLVHEGHDLQKISGGRLCPGKHCEKHGW